MGDWAVGEGEGEKRGGEGGGEEEEGGEFHFGLDNVLGRIGDCGGGLYEEVIPIVSGDEDDDDDDDDGRPSLDFCFMVSSSKARIRS